MKLIFRVKTVSRILEESAKATTEQLKKALGPFDVTMVGIGGIIGAGIFALVGEAAVGGSSGYPAGPALIISFILTAIACGFTALCYSELASMVPISGSAYTYTYATLGELFAWIIGWDLILEYAIGNVAVAISWADYFNAFLKSTLSIDVPLWLRMDYRTFFDKGLDFSTVPHIFGIPIIFNLLAVGIVAFLTFVLMIGIKESSRFNNGLVIFKILILAVFIVVGFYYFDPKNWTPFAPGGFKGIQVGAATIFFAYIGFDAVSTVSEETRNPARDMPIGIIGSLLICTVIYILVTVALTGMIPLANLKQNIAEPLVAALQYNNASGWLVSLISFGAVVACTAVLLVFQLGQPRILFSMSRDGLLPSFFAKVHPKWKTPYVSTICTGLFVGFLAALCNINEMADLCNIGTLFAFVLVSIGVIILRYTDPKRHRPFRVPFGIVLPILGLGFCLFLMLGLGGAAWRRFIGWLLVGMIVYFFYGYKKSKLKS